MMTDNPQHPIQHPLPPGTNIRAKQARCSCTGGGYDIISGTIKRSLTAPSGLWYQLMTQRTIRSEDVIEIVVGGL